ncbi:MAG TPA: heme-binding protein [Candidatus Nanopelagicales bacterium]|nr:heme-binding protein [Candidatus Nanopelagicales bacterium]
MSAPAVRHALDVITRILDAAGGQPVAVVVVDQAGQVVGSARGDGLNAVAVDFARRKAVASATFGAPTRVLSDNFAQDPLLPAAFAGSAEVCLLPGGFPILVDGAPVGGVGISGGHWSQDHEIGEKALT